MLAGGPGCLPASSTHSGEWVVNAYELSSLRSTCVYEKDKGPPLKQISSFVSWAQTRNKAITNTGCPNGWWVQSLWSTLAWAHRLQPDNRLIPPGPCLRVSLSRKCVLQDICRDVDLSICLWLLQIGCHNSKHRCAPEEWGILHCKIVCWNFKTLFRLLDSFSFFFSFQCDVGLVSLFFPSFVYPQRCGCCSHSDAD